MIEFLILLSILFTTTAQVLLKIASLQNKYINKYLIFGYTLFILVIFISYILMHFIELKIFTIIMSINYLTVLISSNIIFKEKINKYKIYGIFSIILGIIIFNF